MATANDTFTGADTTQITSRAMDSGHTWALHTLSTNQPTISGNTLRGVNDSVVLCSITPASADYSQTIDYVTQASGVYAPSLICRADSSALTYYVAWWSESNTRWEIRVRVAGAYTFLASYSGDSPLGTPRTATFSCTGTSLELLVGGVSRITYTDSTITAAGKPGIWTGESTSCYSDNWTFADAGGATINLNPFGGKFQGPFGGKI